MRDEVRWQCLDAGRWTHVSCAYGCALRIITHTDPSSPLQINLGLLDDTQFEPYGPGLKASRCQKRLRWP